MTTGAAGRRMRLTGSNSPDRMLTDQFDSRSESTRTLHSLPSQVAVAMARVVPEGRASVVETRRRVVNVHVSVNLNGSSSETAVHVQVHVQVHVSSVRRERLRREE